MARTKDELIADYEANYNPRGGRQGCLVCDLDDDILEVVNELLRRGAGGTTLAPWVRDRFGVEIGQTTYARHKSLHLNGPAD